MNPGTVQLCTARSGFFQKRNLLVEHDVEQRTVNLQPAVIVNEAQLSESIHEEVNSCPSRTDHFRQSFLAYFRNYVLRISLPFQSGPATKESEPTASQQN